MRNLFLLLSILSLFSCSDSEPGKSNIAQDSLSHADTVIQKDSVAKSSADTSEPQPYSMRYLVISDSSKDYYLLEKSSKELARQLKTKFVKMHMYSKENGLVDDTSDYVYSWRRQYGEDLQEKDITIEEKKYYLGKFNANDDGAMLIIVAGMFYEEKDALKYLEQVKKYKPNAFFKSVNMFIGCRS